MKLSVLLIFLLVFGLTSCNTAYKTLQTPDDVYYSTGRPDGMREETVKEEEPADRNIRMRSRDRRWRNFDDWSYDPYHYGYNNPYYYNPYYYSNPVFGCSMCYYWSNSFIKNSPPRMTNLGSYYNTDRQVVNIKTGNSTKLTGTDRFNNSNNNRNIFRGSRNSGSSGSEGIRSYSPSAPSSSGGSSGSPVFRPNRN